MNTKTNIKLTAEQETLLITLFSKAQENNPLFFDPVARDLMSRIDYDFARLRVPYLTILLICQRARKLDSITRDFLAEHPEGVVLQLGCGLDSRFTRMDNGKVTWYDLDMPQVVELRRNFFTSGERYHLISASVTDDDWLEAVVTGGRPLLVLAEGLLMYLGEAEVRRLVQQLYETFPGCRMAADVFNRFMVRAASIHPSLQHTGASIGWGINDSRALEGWAPGIRLIEEWCFPDDPYLSHISFIYRLAYRFIGAFGILKRAHRVVYYQL